MSGLRIAGILLIVGGVLAVVYGGFTYTESSSEASLGPIAIELENKETVNIPAWAGVAAVIVGAATLLGSAKKA